MYIKINGDNKKYTETIAAFSTQHGEKGIKFIGDPIPTTNKGFKYYDDDDRLKLDLSKYKHPYGPNEYTLVEDEVVIPSPNNDPVPPSEMDRLYSRLNSVSSQVSAITPYTESKTAYIDDEYVTFDGKDGNVSVFMVDGDGKNVPCTFDRENGQIIVRFEKRDSLATVNISIQ